MDRSWMRLNRVSAGYLAGVDSFLEFAFSKTLEPKIPCPCVKCVNRQYHLRNEVRTHLVIYGIIPYYDVWSHHGEEYIPRSQQNQPEFSTSESIRVDGASTPIVPPPPAPASTAKSTPSGSSTRDTGASSTASTPTERPAHPNPMDCLPLHQKTKIGLKNLMAARYNGHRYDIRQKYFDPYTTQEERLAHPPIGWPISQWTEMVEYWGAEDYPKKRKQAIENRGKQVMKHTCGSESIPKKRVENIRKTGQPVELTDLFVDTHTSKKTNSFVDEHSMVAADKMKELASQHTDEGGSCNISDQEIIDVVLGPGTKGRERMKGKTAGRKKGTITAEDVQRAVEIIRRENNDQLEALRRENSERMEALRLETVTNMQSAIQAMIAAGQLMVPPTMPRHNSKARQDTTEDVEK